MKESSPVDISVCGPVIHMGIRVPLIEKKNLLGYKVHPIPVYRNGHYEAVKSYPLLITWSNTEVLEFESNEMVECTKLRNFLLCKRPKKVEKLSKYCFYSLIKQITVKCEFVVEKSAQQYIELSNNFFTYFIPSGKSVLTSIHCHRKLLSTSELRGSRSSIFQRDVPYSLIVTNIQPLWRRLTKSLSSSRSFFYWTSRLWSYIRPSRPL